MSLNKTTNSTNIKNTKKAKIKQKLLTLCAKINNLMLINQLSFTQNNVNSFSYIFLIKLRIDLVIVKPQSYCVIYVANIGFSLHDLGMKYKLIEIITGLLVL